MDAVFCACKQKRQLCWCPWRPNKNFAGDATEHVIKDKSGLQSLQSYTFFFFLVIYILVNFMQGIHTVSWFAGNSGTCDKTGRRCVQWDFAGSRGWRSHRSPCRSKHRSFWYFSVLMKIYICFWETVLLLNKIDFGAIQVLFCCTNGGISTICHKRNLSHTTSCRLWTGQHGCQPSWAWNTESL